MILKLVQQYNSEKGNQMALLYLPTLRFAVESSSIFEPKLIDRERVGRHYARNTPLEMVYTPVIESVCHRN